MHINVDNTEFMTRIDQAIQENIARSAQVFAVMPRDISEREGSWERRFIVAFERRHHGKRDGHILVDYNTLMVCLNSAGESMTVDGRYGFATEDEALFNMLERCGRVGAR
jgi:hypothetical protein